MAPARPRPAASSLLAGLLVLAAMTLHAAGDGESPVAQPLFENTATLAATLSVPLSSVVRSTGDEAFPGTMTLREGEREITLDVLVSPRGYSRRDQCELPPLKLNFRRDQVAGTVFAGQDKLKLVNQCKRKSVHQRYVLQEYAIYRAYLALTPEAYRVRLLELTYVDTGGWYSTRTRPAFLIEADERVAGRLGAVELDLASISAGSLAPNAALRAALFQYLIGNTDWSVLRGPVGDSCCHNGLLLLTADQRRIVVPYDFDQAGLISAEYALPARGLPIRRVSQRLYRGHCTDQTRFEAAVAQFNAQRSAIEAPFRAPEVVARDGDRALGYIADFFEIINDPLERQRKILDVCRGIPAD